MIVEKGLSVKFNWSRLNNIQRKTKHPQLIWRLKKLFFSKKKGKTGFFFLFCNQTSLEKKSSFTFFFSKSKITSQGLKKNYFTIFEDQIPQKNYVNFEEL